MPGRGVLVELKAHQGGWRIANEWGLGGFGEGGKEGSNHIEFHGPC